MPFFADAEQGVREMRRVARPGAPVATCVWDFAEGMTVLRAFWDAAIATGAPDAAEYDQAKSRAYANPDDLRELWTSAGLDNVMTGELIAGAQYAGFDDLWVPLTIPDGAPGRFLVTLDAGQQDVLEHELRRRLGNPNGRFRLTARAWYVVGYANDAELPVQLLGLAYEQRSWPLRAARRIDQRPRSQPRGSTGRRLRV